MQKLTSHGHEIDTSPAKFGTLRDSGALVGDAPALRRPIRCSAFEIAASGLRSSWPRIDRNRNSEASISRWFPFHGTDSSSGLACGSGYKRSTASFAGKRERAKTRKGQEGSTRRYGDTEKNRGKGV